MHRAGPAQQSFETHELVEPGAEHGLIDQRELAALQGEAQIVLEFAAVLIFAFHRGVVGGEIVTAFVLDPVQGAVGPGEQIVRGFGIGRVVGDANRGREGEFGLPLEHHGAHDVFEQAPGEALRRFGLLAERLDHDELVAADAGDQIGFADVAGKAAGHFAQHVVPGGMAIEIVDRFETIEIKAEDSNRFAAAGCLGQD